MKETINTYREKVDKRLVIRQRIFILIILILVGVSIVNVVEGKISAEVAIGGFAVTLVLGLAMSRMFKIFWHQEKGKVVSQLDAVGIVLLVLYIGLEISRQWIFQHWLSGAALNAFGLVILTGLLLGRFIGTSIRIKNALSENEDGDTAN